MNYVTALCRELVAEPAQTYILVAHSGLLFSAYSHQSGETPHGCLYSVCWLKASQLAGSGFWRVKLSQLPALVF